jgi:rRNA maturation RNase YbeY
MIEINNLTTNPIDENFLKEIVKLVLEGEKKEGKISFVFVGPRKMRKLNKKYFNKNRVIDFLVFPSSKVLFEKSGIGSLQKFDGLGEIVICLKEIKKKVKRFGQSFEKELAKALIEGILHLLGQDQEKENYYLKLIENYGYHRS